VRWRNFEAKALEKAYLRAKDQRSRFMFELNLCGPQAFMRHNRIDRVEAAIEQHALRPDLTR
jgi:hypothetical protein